jgi:hypothetical protein
MKMKFTKIMIAAAACLALTAGKTMAQSGRLSIGVEVAQPLGDFGDGSSTGFGGSLRYEFPMGEKLGLTITGGWMTFSGKETTYDPLPGIVPAVTTDGPSISMIPVQAGLKFYFKEQQAGLYVMGEVGVHAISFGEVDGESLDGHTGLSYAPAIGFHMAKIDIGLRYQFFDFSTSYDDGMGNSVESGSTEGYVGLRAAFVFGGDK